MPSLCILAIVLCNCVNGNFVYCSFRMITSWHTINHNTLWLEITCQSGLDCLDCLLAVVSCRNIVMLHSVLEYVICTVCIINLMQLLTFLLMIKFGYSCNVSLSSSRWRMWDVLRRLTSWCRVILSTNNGLRMHHLAARAMHCTTLI